MIGLIYYCLFLLRSMSVDFFREKWYRSSLGLSVDGELTGNGGSVCLPPYQCQTAGASGLCYDTLLYSWSSGSSAQHFSFTFLVCYKHKELPVLKTPPYPPLAVEYVSLNLLGLPFPHLGDWNSIIFPAAVDFRCNKWTVIWEALRLVHGQLWGLQKMSAIIIVMITSDKLLKTLIFPSFLFTYHGNTIPAPTFTVF